MPKWTLTPKEDAKIQAIFEGNAMHDERLDAQQEAQLEGLAIGLEQRGEKSAAHLIRRALADLRRLRAHNQS